MTGEKKAQRTPMSAKDKKKYRVKVHRVGEDIIDNYEDVSSPNPNYKRTNISSVVDGNEFYGVLKGKYRYSSNQS